MLDIVLEKLCFQWIYHRGLPPPWLRHLPIRSLDIRPFIFQMIFHNELGSDVRRRQMASSIPAAFTQWTCADSSWRARRQKTGGRTTQCLPTNVPGVFRWPDVKTDIRALPSVLGLQTGTARGLDGVAANMTFPALQAARLARRHPAFFKSGVSETSWQRSPWGRDLLHHPRKA